MLQDPRAVFTYEARQAWLGVGVTLALLIGVLLGSAYVGKRECYWIVRLQEK